MFQKRNCGPTRSAVVLAVLFLLATATAGRADTVVLKNGDKLTGTISAIDAGTLTIKVLGLGNAKVDMTEIDSFSTDSPATLRFADGSTATQKISLQNGGMVQLDGGLVGPHPVAISTMTAFNPPAVVWAGSVQAGAIFIRGNTDTDSIDFSGNLERKTDQDKMFVSGSYLYGTSRNRDTGIYQTTADHWIAEAGYDYNFTKQLYGYADVQVSKDRLALIALRVVPSVGLGYKWFDGPKFSFATEAGIAGIYQEYTNGTPKVETAAGRLAYHVLYKFNDDVSVFHDFEYLRGFRTNGTTLIDTDLGLRAHLNKHLFVEGKVTLDFDSHPAGAQRATAKTPGTPGALKTDTTFTLDIGYSL